jgi:site-specific DNA recombinase
MIRKMKRVACMSRVSSDEQAAGYSLASQRTQLEEHCLRNDVTNRYSIVEDHSAKTFDRPEFQKFLRFVKDNPGQIDGLIFVSWDRFSRNTTDAYLMIRELKKLGIEAQATTQPIDFTIPESKIILAIYLSVPEADNDRRSLKIIDGIRAAKRSGRYVSGAPVGLKYGRDEFNKPILIPNPKTAGTVLWAFEQINTGRPQISVLKEARREFGVKWSKSSFALALRNPLYIGNVIVPAYDGEPEYIVKGVHEPIISEELFYSVQAVITGKRKARWAGSKNSKVRPELPLRGHLLCSKCNRTLTGSASKSRNGDRHFYYHCNFCHHERVAALKLNAAFTSILAGLKFKKGPTELYSAFVKKYLQGGKDERKKKLLGLELELEKTRQRQRNLKIKYADNEITKADYLDMCSPFNTEEAALIRNINEMKDVKGEYEEFVRQGLDFFHNLPGAFEKADSVTKNSLIGSIYPEKLTFDGVQCRTTRINEVLLLMLLLDEGFSGNKKGQALRNLGLSGLVENTGVEPVTSCMPCKRSSQLS